MSTELIEVRWDIDEYFGRLMSGSIELACIKKDNSGKWGVMRIGSEFKNIGSYALEEAKAYVLKRFSVINKTTF